MKQRKLAGIAGLLMFAATCHSGSAFAGVDVAIRATDPCNLSPISPPQGDDSYLVKITLDSIPAGYTLDSDMPILFVDPALNPYPPPADTILKIHVKTKPNRTIIKFLDLNPIAAKYDYILNVTDAQKKLLKCPIGPIHPLTSPAGITNPGQ